MNIRQTIRLGFAAVSAMGFFGSTIPSVDAAASPEAMSNASAPRNVSRWVVSAQKIGEAEGAQNVHLSLFLGFKNQPELKALIAAQSTPGNALYGKYLTPEEFRARFAPDATKVAQVQDTLRTLGLTVEYTPKSGLFVNATGTVSQVKTAFGVSQGLYSYKGKTLRANAESPRLPAKIADIVTYIAGLDDTAVMRQSQHVSFRNDTASAVKAATTHDMSGAKTNAPPPVAAGINSQVCSTYWGDHYATLSTTPGFYPKKLPWLICGYTPQQMRQAYGIDKVPETGQGVRVAIVDVYASPTIVADTNRYAANHGLPLLTYVNFQQLVPPGIYNVPASDPCGPQGWYEEESLDVQAVHSLAPGAFILFAGIACTDPGNAPLYTIIDDHLADIITNSYTYNGEILSAGFIESENQYFMQAAAEGISVLFSSGDDGDISAANGIASGSWEATSPYVTAVGGTSLALLDSSGKKLEWGWGDYRAFLNAATVNASGTTITTSGVALPFTFYSGAGGGPSLSELALPYQKKVPYSYSGFTKVINGLTVTTVPLQSPHRVTPDIAMLADPYTGFIYGESYTIAGDPIADYGCKATSKTVEYCEEDIGGTSLASPAFAGVLALVDEARLANGKAPIGFANPFLYSLPVGAPGTSTAPIIDVRPPLNPTGLLRGYMGDNTRVRVITMNSAPNLLNTAVVEGADTSYTTAKDYDEVTGIGTPNVPALIQSAIK
jgi:subtilase family serine protease